MSSTISNTSSIGHAPSLPNTAAQTPNATPTPARASSRHNVMPTILGAIAAGRPGRMAGLAPRRNLSTANLPPLPGPKPSVASNDTRSCWRSSPMRSNTVNPAYLMPNTKN